MATKDLSQFHELAEQSRGKISLKQFCKQNRIGYHTYRLWRNRMGIPLRNQSGKTAMPGGMVEVAIDDMPVSTPAPKVTKVRIVFENGLTFDRQEMEVDILIDFLTKIRAALCLG